jgi:hypothetical protein
MDMSASCITCGKKSQDYGTECPCCGNYYCSDQCSLLGHNKQFAHHQWTDYKHIYGEVMSFDPKVRVVTICDLNGEVMYSGHRKGVKNLLTSKESKESLELAVNGWKARREFAPKIGKGKYVLVEYEKVKRLILPLGTDHLLYITTEVGCDHASLITKIQKLHL